MEKFESGDGYAFISSTEERFSGASGDSNCDGCGSTTEFNCVCVYRDTQPSGPPVLEEEKSKTMNDEELCNWLEISVLELYGMSEFTRTRLILKKLIEKSEKVKELEEKIEQLDRKLATVGKW